MTLPLLDLCDRLPFGGITSQSRHASHQAAVRVLPGAASQCARLLLWWDVRDSGTDEQASEALHIRRYIVPARRRAMMTDARNWVEPCGHDAGGITQWRLTAAGKQAARTLRVGADGQPR